MIIIGLSRKDINTIFYLKVFKKAKAISTTYNHAVNNNIIGPLYKSSAVIKRLG